MRLLAARACQCPHTSPLPGTTVKGPREPLQALVSAGRWFEATLCEPPDSHQVHTSGPCYHL